MYCQNWKSTSGKTGYDLLAISRNGRRHGGGVVDWVSDGQEPEPVISREYSPLSYLQTILLALSGRLASAWVLFGSLLRGTDETQGKTGSTGNGGFGA